MDIYAMHVLFRTLGQQQGLQLIRGILAESIDNFINESIHKVLSTLLYSNVQPSKDSHTPQYTKISPLNAFHTLYCTQEQNIVLENEGEEINIVLSTTPFSVTNFVLKYSDEKKYDCRIIEHERLQQTLNDYINRASRDYPIVSLTNGIDDKTYKISIFTGNNQQDVTSIITSYIKMPSVVKLDEEYYGTIRDTSVSCDLPEHLHRSIVEGAVQLWFETLGLTSNKPQQENINKQ